MHNLPFSLQRALSGSNAAFDRDRAEEFAGAVRDWIELKELTNGELARMAGLSAPTVNSALRGHRVTDATVDAIEHATGLDFEELRERGERFDITDERGRKWILALSVADEEGVV